MDILEYTETVSATSLETARRGYDEMHERAYKLGSLLVAGGGAVGAYALGRLGLKAAAPVEWAPLAALSLSWLAIAGILVLKGATSKEFSPGNGPKHLRNYYYARLAETPGDEARALETTRHAELDRVQERLRAYNVACAERALAIDRAYGSIALCSPLVPLVTTIFCVLRA